jgi:hypothetical protein
MSGSVVFLRITSASGRPFSMKETTSVDEIEWGQGARSMIQS